MVSDHIADHHAPQLLSVQFFLSEMSYAYICIIIYDIYYMFVFQSCMFFIPFINF